jgi:hypothetical protein
MRRKWLYVAAAAVGVLLLGVELASHLGGESAERRVRRYFDVPGALDTVSLRAAVLRRVPIGSPESTLADFVVVKGIGADGHSVYRPATSDDVAVIRLDEKPAPLDLVTEAYIIAFELDGARRVRGIGVRHAFTGP